MCLIKVYLSKGEDKELVAEDVAFAVKERDKVVLRSLDFEDTSTIEDVDISYLDMVNSIMVIVPKGEEVLQ